MTTGATEQVTSVPGELKYLDPKSTVLRRFTAPGESVNTGTYEFHVVPIQNARSVEDTFRFDTAGFELVHHESAVADFTDKEQVDAVYVPEVVDFIQQKTGADQVAGRASVHAWAGWERRSTDPAMNNSQPPASLVHVDWAPEAAEKTAQKVYAEQFPDGPGYSRSLVTSFWRAFSPPPQDWPLAVCDFRSVGDDEGRTDYGFFVDQIPDDPFADIDVSDAFGSGSEFHYSPDFEWWYFPNMTRDEALLIVLHDSDHNRAWRSPHTAFRDETVRDAVPRHSIEFRTFAFFR